MFNLYEFNLYDILSKCRTCICILTYTWPKFMVYNLVSMLNFWGVSVSLVHTTPRQIRHQTCIHQWCIRSDAIISHQARPVGCDFLGSKNQSSVGPIINGVKPGSLNRWDRYHIIPQGSSWEGYEGDTPPKTNMEAKK